MQKQFIELMTPYVMVVRAAVKRFGELNLKTMERLSGAQAEVFRQCADSTAEHLEAISGGADVNQLFKRPNPTGSQAAFGQQRGEKLVANAREFAAVFGQAGDELSEISEHAATDAAEKMQQAGEMLKEVA